MPVAPNSAPSALVNLASGGSGILPVANGGTGGITAALARTSLSAAASGANTDITGLSLTGDVAIAAGVSTIANNAVNAAKMAAGSVQLGVLTGANLNVTTDQAIAISATKYVIRKIIAYDVSTSLALGLAAGGVYSTAAKGGVAIVAAAQLWTALTSATKALDLTIDAAGIGLYFTAGTLYLSLTTANGSAATATIAIFGDKLA